jgi:SAM-dependent methyltransferase
MRTEQVRVGSTWLALRESADAAVRSPELVKEVQGYLSTDRGATVHDLGCGTGSMARWLAPQLTGPQRWVMYDRDSDLLAIAAANQPDRAFDGGTVTIETRQLDITQLDHWDLKGADLITASAVLDMMTSGELERLVAACAGAGCPVLITLSVTGRVELTPTDPLDQRVTDAFNAHQRRRAGTRRPLGPDAAGAAVDGFTRLGVDVLVRPSPWRLGPGHTALAAEWFLGWLGAACDQRPDLRSKARSYARRRLDEAAAGRLCVTVHHLDLLALPT